MPVRIRSTARGAFAPKAILHTLQGCVHNSRPDIAIGRRQEGVGIGRRQGIATPSNSVWDGLMPRQAGRDRRRAADRRLASGSAPPSGPASQSSGLSRPIRCGSCCWGFQLVFSAEGDNLVRGHVHLLAPPNPLVRRRVPDALLFGKAVAEGLLVPADVR